MSLLEKYGFYENLALFCNPDNLYSKVDFDMGLIQVLPPRDEEHGSWFLEISDL